MGNFYVNHTVKTTDRDGVVAALRRAKRRALVGPVEDGYVVVFDRDSDNQCEVDFTEVGNLLSRELAAPVLAVLNHDDDLLCYWLFENGAATDHYNSCPDYFEGEFDEIEEFDDGEDEEDAAAELGTDGDPALLCRAFGVDDVAAVEDAMRGEGFLFALLRHQELAAALGLPSYSVGAGYRYAKQGDLDIDRGELIKVP